jgi:aspartate racemase
MPLHIGIVACSAEGAALCYRTIAGEAPAIMGRHAHPELSMHTFPLSAYMEPVYRDDWHAVGEMMLASGRKLQALGADFLLCPDNTVHQGLDLVRERSALPWLHIAEAVAEAAAQAGYKHVGLTGTKYLMEGPVYPAKLAARGIDVAIPPPSERDRINDIIFENLVYGRFLPADLSYFQQVIEKMKRAGCDAVILGCTEIPLLVAPHDSPLPVLDSTRLLARAALRKAVDGSHAAWPRL